MRLAPAVVGRVLLAGEADAALVLIEDERPAADDSLGGVAILLHHLPRHDPEDRGADLGLERGIDILQLEDHRAVIWRGHFGDRVEDGLLRRDLHEALEGPGY